MQYIQAMNFVSLGNWQVEGYQGQNIRFGDSQGSIKTSNEVWQLTKIDELRRMRVISETNTRLWAFSNNNILLQWTVVENGPRVLVFDKLKDAH